MIYNLSNPYEQQGFLDHVTKLLDAGAMVELKKKSPKRSLAQNAYLHLILGYFGSEYGASLDEVKVDFFKRECNRDIFERESVNKKGKTVKYLRSSAELTTAEMTLAIERFRNWSASVAQIYLPSPNEEQFLAYCEQEIERNKMYV